MTAGGPPETFAAALFAALDERRRARGLGWAQATREISASISESPSRRIAASTVTGMTRRRVIEGDGVLQMLLWLGLSPESLDPARATPPSSEFDLPRPPLGRVLRFDTAKLYEALEARRAERGLTWNAVAEQVGGGTTTSSLRHLKEGGRTGFPTVLWIGRWLGQPLARFTRVTRA